MKLFKSFIEGNTDPFGFDELEKRKDNQDVVPREEEELPIRPFSVQWFSDVLARQKIHGRISSSHAFLDEVIWGEKKIGSVRVRLSPNITIFIEKLTEDLLGAPTWVLKRVLRPKLREYAGKEEEVSYEVFEEVQNLYDQGIDSAAEKYDGLLTLTKRMADRVRTHAPLIYDYQDTKQVNKNYYIIYFSIRNAGVGKLVSRGQQTTQSPEATIDVNFNQERGLIHVILTTVSIGGKGQGWEIDLPYLDGYFAPSQKKDEIINTILTALKYY